MHLLDSIILGAVQGITEFLPVSSTAHTALYQKIFSLHSFGRNFDILLNLGTLLALILYFFKDFLKIFLGGWNYLDAFGGRLHLHRKLRTLSKGTICGLPFFRYRLRFPWNGSCSEKENNAVFFVIIFLANLPTIILFFFLSCFNVKIISVKLTAINLIVFGVILYLCDQKPTDKKDISAKDAIKIGIAQMLAFFPGVSRLGICLSMCRYLGYDRRESFRFSMIFSIIPVAGACTLKLTEIYKKGVVGFSCIEALAGIVSAFIFGMISVFVVSKFLKKHSFTPIVIYRIIFGISVWFL